MSEEFFNKARKIARDIDRGTYMKETDEYKVCSLEEAEEFAKKRMEQYQADYIKRLGEGLESSIALNKAQVERLAELENQLEKCSHHEAMAHQGGYEIGKALQIKELSDEEIKTLHEETSWFGISDPIKFAKAILKKAIGIKHDEEKNNGNH
jgi:hypothetical protein